MKDGQSRWETLRLLFGRMGAQETRLHLIQVLNPGCPQCQRPGVRGMRCSRPNAHFSELTPSASECIFATPGDTPLAVEMHTETRLSRPPDDWIYLFEDISVEPRAHRLERNGQAVSVEPKAYAVLIFMLENAGALIDKNMLLDVVWGHREVTPAVLSRVISQLRRALGDSAARPHLIATVYCLGYRFIGKVRRQEIPVDHGAGDADSAAVSAALPIERRQPHDRRCAIERRANPPRAR